MKAQVLRRIGDIRLEEIEKPRPSQGEVLVKVRACGICGSDVPRVYETGAHRMPLVIGHEFSGEVAEVGEGVEPNWSGKRVGIFPLIPCMKCPQCLAKRYEMCESYNYLGSRCDGGFAEYAAVPVWNLLELPEDVSFEEAAMLEPMAVAVHAIRRSGIRLQNDMEDKVSAGSAALPLDSPIAVCGLGTIGLFVVMFLMDAGYSNVYAIGNKPLQKEKAAALGLPPKHYIEGGSDGCRSMLTQTIQPQVFFDCVGKNEILVRGMECAAPNGTVVAVGNPASDMIFPKEVYWKILRKQLMIIGTWNSSFTKEAADDWHYVLQRLSSGGVHPDKVISHRFDIENMQNGLEIMRDKSEPYAKIMVGFS